MIVCICAAVNDRKIRSLLDQGKTQREIKDITGACKQCCKCNQAIREVCQSYLESVKSLGK